MVTIAKSASETVSVAMDLTKEWDLVSPQGSLVQGCVVVRSEFAQEHPAEVDTFLAEYQASIEALLADPAAVSVMIESAGIFNKAPVAQKAIPNCNICFLKGEEMKEKMKNFLEIMFETAPQSIGGAIPGDDFYYIEG